MSPALLERELEREKEDVGLVRRFSLDLDRLFDDFGVRPRFFRPAMPQEFTWSPDVEVFERNGRFNVRADLPGLAKEDVKVHVIEGMLTIEGERKREVETKREGYYRSERSYGTFLRSIPLPEGSKVDQIQATFKNGVLDVTMPLAIPEKTAKMVDVKVV
jgi:HSP20 family protein